MFPAFANQFVAVAVAVVAASCCCPPHALAASPLQVELTAAADHVLLHEGVLLTVALVNTGDEPLDIRADFLAERGLGTVNVRDPNGGSITVRHARYRGRDGFRSKEELLSLPPGGRFEFTLFLACEYSRGAPADVGSIFNRTGEYQIKAQYEHRDLVVDSNPIVISVIEPQGAEARALQLVRNLKHPWVFYEPTIVSADDLSEMMPALEAIAAVEDSMIYANYARYALARIHILIAWLAFDMPKVYNLESELQAAEKHLAAIGATEFAITDRVEQARQEVAAIKARRDAAD